MVGKKVLKIKLEKNEMSVILSFSSRLRFQKFCVSVLERFRKLFDSVADVVESG